MRRREHKRGGWRGGLKPSGSVNLISMMDILTVLLLFLLKSYVAGGEVMVPQAGVRLPESTADQLPQTSLIVAIRGDAILVGSEKVASLSEAMAGEGPEIAPLAARLRAIAPVSAAGVAAAGTPTRMVTIQGDRDIEYRVLRRVMYTLSENGYENVSLAVLRRS